jgi:hypothetical protein
MVDLDDVPVAVVVAALSHGHHAAIRRVDGSAFARCNVDAEMPGPVIVAGQEAVLSAGHTNPPPPTARPGIVLAGPDVPEAPLATVGTSHCTNSRSPPGSITH